MNIPNLKQAASLIEGLQSDSLSNEKTTGTNDVFSIGTNYYIRTVTHHQVGRCKGVEFVGQIPFLILENASWVADSGRWHDALKNGFGISAEIEPCVGLVRVNVASSIDVFDWNHDLPTKQQ